MQIDGAWKVDSSDLPEEYDASTPEGTVHLYLLAASVGDCDGAAEFANEVLVDTDCTAGEGRPGISIGIEVETVSEQGDTASVTVTNAMALPGDESTVDYELVRVDDDTWRIESSSGPLGSTLGGLGPG